MDKSISTLVEKFPTKKTDYNDNTLFHYLPRESNRIIDNFVKTGLIVNAKNTKENSTDCDLIISEIINILIQNDIDINAKNYYGRTALHEAVYYDNDVMVDLLLKAGADPNLLDRKGNTPLYLSLEYNKKEISLVKRLIDAGANVNALDSAGRSCVFHAARYASVELLNLLIDHGATINLMDLKGRNPLDYALIHWGREMWSEIIVGKTKHQNFNNDKVLENKFEKQKIEDQKECLEILCEQGLKINCIIKFNFSYRNIHFVSFNHTKIIRLLILKGAIVDFVLSEGQKDFGSSIDYSESPSLYTRHAALCNSYKNGNGIVNFDYERLNEEQKQYYEDCVKELQKLKNCLVYESMPLSNLIEGPVSSYYIFHENLIEMFESGFIARTYPICNDLLVEHYEYKQAKHELIVNATAGLQRLIKFNNHSVDLIYHNILQYLSIKDRRIVASFANTVTFESTSQQ